jgi:Cytochrome P450
VVFWLTESDLLTADRPTHTRQRRLLSHAFSEKALREQEGIIQSYVKVFLDQLSFRAASGSLDLVDWFNFISQWLNRVPNILANSSDG